MKTFMNINVWMYLLCENSGYNYKSKSLSNVWFHNLICPFSLHMICIWYSFQFNKLHFHRYFEDILDAISFSQWIGHFLLKWSWPTILLCLFMLQWHQKLLQSWKKKENCDMEFFLPLKFWYAARNMCVLIYIYKIIIGYLSNVKEMAKNVFFNLPTMN